MDLITITLNPAYDLHYTIENFRPYKENIVDAALVAAGGKGINISRALRKNGKESAAFVVLGQENRDLFEKILREEGLPYTPFYVPGRIRENITLHTKDAPETRISFDDFALNEAMLEGLYDALSGRITPGAAVAFSGRLPKGIGTERALAFLEKIRASGASIAVDCASLEISALVRLRPWLIKPNEQEIETLCQAKVNTLADALQAAKALCALGIAHVLVSMGGRGAAYAGRDAEGRTLALVATVPPITPLSTIGAGDSTVAGFLSGMADGLPLPECLRRAMAFGSAACLTEGTLPPRPEDVAALLPKITVTPAV